MADNISHALSVVERLRTRYDAALKQPSGIRAVWMDRSDMESLEALADHVRDWLRQGAR